MASIITEEIHDYCSKYFALDVDEEEGKYSHFILMSCTKEHICSVAFCENVICAMAYIEKETGYMAGSHSCHDYIAIVTFINPDIFKVWDGVCGPR